MKNLFLYILSFFFYLTAFTQETKIIGDQFPKFKSCDKLQSTALENCFYNNVQDFVYNNFKVPQSLNAYTGTIIVLFEVDATGKFKTIYVDANEKLMIEESKRVFENMPIIAPATYNGNPTYAKYTYKIAIPLKSVAQTNADVIAEKNKLEASPIYKRDLELKEFENIVYQKFNNPQFKSNLNVPFSHAVYAQFDEALNQVGSNNHSGVKPYVYADVAKYHDFNTANEKIKKTVTGWWSRKFWNENLVEIQGENYWFTFNPIVDLQLGKSVAKNSNSTFINTRGIQFQGGLGKQVSFTTTIFESQGQFADYFNLYANSLRPAGGGPAIIPGIGIAKDFKTNSYDFPSAEANISFTPNQFFNAQLGYGRNFIGDGYRSLFQTDGASPHPFFKLNTSFWKIKYTNTYMFLKDVRSDVTSERTYATKYIANHYLSWNLSKRFNIGLFESVIWGNNNGRGFDFNFLNPIVFYRTVEFSSSARSGNAVLGLSGKYKYNNQINFYGQFLLDEFSLDEIKSVTGSWKNKFGYQLGVKYYNAFNIDNLNLQLEYNYVRPYVYAHLDATTNYGHNNQNIGHQWGGNFNELIGIARYTKGRYYANVKLTTGRRGLDFDPAIDNNNYGGNIYRSYNELRPFDKNVVVGQGNKTNVFIADLQAGYLINPTANLKFFGSVIYRNFNLMQDTPTSFKDNTTWFSVGLRSDVFNWYFDY